MKQLFDRSFRVHINKIYSGLLMHAGSCGKTEQLHLVGAAPVISLCTLHGRCCLSLGQPEVLPFSNRVETVCCVPTGVQT